ncbi:MAG: universal stress protein [Deltaproteobacteria bacterium]|nr:universal stress protein [Deltaproteobacteria bacterium]
MLRRILVPVDFSRSSRAALEYATLLAGRFEAEIELLHVWDPERRKEDRDLVSLGLHSCTEAGRKMKEWLLSLAPALRERAHGRLEVGDPCARIVEAAGRHDLVVMGTRDRPAMARLLHGSVAQKVARRSHCPVLTVHAEPEAPVQRAPLGILVGEPA